MPRGALCVNQPVRRVPILRRAATIDSYTGEDLARAVVQGRHPGIPVRPVIDRVPDLGGILAVRHVVAAGRAVFPRPANALGLFRLLVAPKRAEVIGGEVCPGRRLVVAGRADPLLDELCDSCFRRRALAALRRRTDICFAERRRAGRGLEAEAVFIYLVDAPV